MKNRTESQKSLSIKQQRAGNISGEGTTSSIEKRRGNDSRFEKDSRAKTTATPHFQASLSTKPKVFPGNSQSSRNQTPLFQQNSRFQPSPDRRFLHPINKGKPVLRFMKKTSKRTTPSRGALAPINHPPIRGTPGDSFRFIQPKRSVTRQTLKSHRMPPYMRGKLEPLLRNEGHASESPETGPIYGTNQKVTISRLENTRDASFQRHNISHSSEKRSKIGFDGFRSSSNKRNASSLERQNVYGMKVSSRGTFDSRRVIQKRSPAVRRELDYENYSEDEIPSDFSADFSAGATTLYSNPSSHERKLINAKVLGAGTSKVRIGALSHSPARMRAAGGALHFSRHQLSQQSSQLGKAKHYVSSIASGLYPGQAHMHHPGPYKVDYNPYLPAILATSDEAPPETPIIAGGGKISSQYIITSGTNPMNSGDLQINRHSPDITEGIREDDEGSNVSKHHLLEKSRVPRKVEGSSRMLLQTSVPTESALEYERENPALIELRDNPDDPFPKTVDIHRSSIIQGRVQTIPSETANRRESGPRTPDSQKKTPRTALRVNSKEELTENKPKSIKPSTLPSNHQLRVNSQLASQAIIMSRSNFSKAYSYRVSLTTRSQHKGVLSSHYQPPGKRNKKLPPMRLLLSVFKYRCPTLFFQYSPDISIILKNEKRVQDAEAFLRSHNMHRIHDFEDTSGRFNTASMMSIKSKIKSIESASPRNLNLEARYFFKYSEGAQLFNSVLDTLFCGGIELMNSSQKRNSWNLLLCSQVRAEQLAFMQPGQKVCHFPGSNFLLGVKDGLWLNLLPYKMEFREQFSFLPQTYILPDELRLFEMNRDNAAVWILKPASLSQGRGIRLIGKRTPIDKLSNFVVQRYILKPHLLNGFKYDIRLYVCVTSFDPLKIYLYKEGLVRLATEPYTINPRYLKNSFMHLTNFSVNSKNDGKFHAKEGDYSSSKWTLEMLKAYYLRQGIDPAVVFSRIKDIIVKALVALSPHINYQLKRYYKYCPINSNPCFELYGFDLLLDQDLNPQLLEINTAPSLSCPTDLDKRIKYSLVNDLYTLIGLQPPEVKDLFSQVDFKQDTKGKGNFPFTPFQHSQIFTDLKKVQEEEEEEILDHTGVSFNPRSKEKRVEAMESIEHLTSGELEVILQYEEQNYRKGNFERIFPLEQNFSHYSRFLNWTGERNQHVAAGLERLGIKVVSMQRQPSSLLKTTPGNQALFKYLSACVESSGAARQKLQRFAHRVSHIKV